MLLHSETTLAIVWNGHMQVRNLPAIVGIGLRTLLLVIVVATIDSTVGIDAANAQSPVVEAIPALPFGPNNYTPSESATLPQPAPQQPTLPQPAIQQPAIPPTMYEGAGAQPITNTQVTVGLPSASPSTYDRLLVQPQVQYGVPLNDSVNPMDPNWLMSHRPSAAFSSPEQLSLSQEMLPSPQPMQFGQPQYYGPPEPVEAAPVFESLLDSAPPPLPIPRRLGFGSGEVGLGQERLAFALFDIDSAQPFNNLRIRAALANRMHLPDRAEYFWAKTVTGGGPPLPESVIDYQEARIRMETGSKKISTAFELPFRSTDPDINKNHAGLGDMQLIVKTVLLDGKSWMLTQYFGTRFASGNAKAGLGTGKVGLEPGLLFRNEFREDTWMHGELKFWFPLGADPVHGGQVLKLASGVNRVLHQTDHNAWIPSLELSAYSVLNGGATTATGLVRPVDHDAIFYLTPGMHYAVDNRGDFGLFEVGCAVSIAMSRERFSDDTWIFDMRWSW